MKNNVVHPKRSDHAQVAGIIFVDGLHRGMVDTKFRGNYPKNLAPKQ